MVDTAEKRGDSDTEEAASRTTCDVELHTDHDCVNTRRLQYDALAAELGTTDEPPRFRHFQTKKIVSCPVLAPSLEAIPSHQGCGFTIV